MISTDDPIPAILEPDEAPAPVVRTPADEFAWWRNARPSFVATYLLGTPGYARWMAAHAPDDRATALLRHDDGASGVGGRIARKGMRFVRRVRAALETMTDLEAVAAFPEDIPLVAALRTGVLEASEGAEWSAVSSPVQECHFPAQKQAQEQQGATNDPEPIPTPGSEVIHRFQGVSTGEERLAASRQRGLDRRWEAVRAEKAKTAELSTSSVGHRWTPEEARLAGSSPGRMVDLTGVRVGLLVMVSPLRYLNGRVYWLARCDCGGEREIRSDYVRSVPPRVTACLDCGAKARAEGAAKGNASRWGWRGRKVSPAEDFG